MSISWEADMTRQLLGEGGCALELHAFEQRGCKVLLRTPCLA